MIEMGSIDNQVRQQWCMVTVISYHILYLLGLEKHNMYYNTFAVIMPSQVTESVNVSKAIPCLWNKRTSITLLIACNSYTFIFRKDIYPYYFIHIRYGGSNIHSMTNKAKLKCVG